MNARDADHTRRHERGGDRRRARPEAPRIGGPGRRRPDRQRASHSMESVLTEAVAILDSEGQQALTFRALAARLGTGVGSIYWYVANKDELLDRAADFVMEHVLADIEPYLTGPDPIENLRSIGTTLYDATVQRRWLGAYFMRANEFQPMSLTFYERIGEQVQRLGLTPRQTFHGASSIVGFVVGIAADMGQELPAAVRSGELNREQYMATVVAAWRDLDPQEFPFLHAIIDEFEDHDDADQFRAGLDLILAGLRLQADRTD